MKLINKEEMKKLENHGDIRNTVRGYVDKRGFTIGFYRTRHRTYIEDKYADIAKKLV